MAKKNSKAGSQASNYVALAYAVVGDKGFDTSKMSKDEVVAKYEELTGRTGRYNIASGQPEEQRESRMVVPKANGFNRSNTKSHLNHAKEMGLNEKQYIRAAEEFFNSGAGKVYFDKNGDYYKFDSLTGLLCICKNNGAIKTFFKPKKKNHFAKLIKQFNLEEI